MLCKAFPPMTGGVETYSERVARAYRKTGLPVTVITQTAGITGWQRRSYPEGDVEVFNTGSGNQLITALKMVRALRLSLSDRVFDVHHATTWRPALAFAGARRRAPIVISVHGREVPSAPAVLQPLMRRVFSTADLVVAVSSATQSRTRTALSTAATRRWIMAGNGISYPPEPPRAARDTGSVRLLTLARLVERKNIQGVIHALSSLRDRGITNFDYRIAGTGPLSAQLREQARSAGLGELIHFLGYVDSDDVPALYRWADVFVHPQIDTDNGNDFEGFGISIADAMAFGCLVIAGSGSGPDDFVKDGDTGVLVDGADPVRLSKTFESVLRDLSAYQVIAQRGQQYARTELSWDKHVSAILSALELRETKPSYRARNTYGDA